MSTLIHRQEIDGLRAVAIVPVILFHAGFASFSGGYIGVDVFFVISGYLITTILINDLETGQFSLARFYERRARRILPALFFMLLCCLPFAWLWMLPVQFKDFSQALIAVTLFASNILFWQKTDYFAPVAVENPLLHTWSLAVEEQFYIFFPILLWLLWRYGRGRVIWVVAGLCVISLAASEWGWRNAPSANFYLIVTRAWELGAGAICAFVLHGRMPRSNTGLAAIGLGLIVFSMFGYDAETPFPSLYALVPVGGTALIILFAGPETIVGRILSLRGVVGVGLISYSAYLWHQPLFAFARIRSFGYVEDTLMLTLAAASLGVGWLSWRYVERPFRHGGGALPGRSGVFMASAAGLVAFMGFGLYGHLSNGREVAWERSLSAEAATFADFLNYTDGEDNFSQFLESGCFFSGHQESLQQYRKDTCLALSEESQNVLLLGDSHAAHFAQALVEFYPGAHWLQATASGCKPVIKGDGAQPCLDMYAMVFDLLPEMASNLDGVVLSARWRASRDAPDLIETIRYLQDLGLRVAVLGPTIEYHSELPAILANLSRINGAVPERMRILLASDPIDELEIARSATDAGASFVSIRDIICSGEGCLVLSGQQEPLQFDYAHFTLSGARTVMARGFPDNIDLLFDNKLSD